MKNADDMSNFPALVTHMASDQPAKKRSPKQAQDIVTYLVKPFLRTKRIVGI
jgi:hypothetical protein